MNFVDETNGGEWRWKEKHLSDVLKFFFFDSSFDYKLLKMYRGAFFFEEVLSNKVYRFIHRLVNCYMPRSSQRPDNRRGLKFAIQPRNLFRLSVLLAPPTLIKIIFGALFSKPKLVCSPPDTFCPFRNEGVGKRPKRNFMEKKIWGFGRCR